MHNNELLRALGDGLNFEESYENWAFCIIVQKCHNICDR